MLLRVSCESTFGTEIVTSTCMRNMIGPEGTYYEVILPEGRCMEIGEINI